jgi:CBS domain containing-hemolysin-like protein
VRDASGKCAEHTQRVQEHSPQLQSAVQVQTKGLAVAVLLVGREARANGVEAEMIVSPFLTTSVVDALAKLLAT